MDILWKINHIISIAMHVENYVSVHTKMIALVLTNTF